PASNACLMRYWSTFPTRTKGAGPPSPNSATIAERVSGFTGACSVSIMNHSNPIPFSASRETRDDEEIHVPKQGFREVARRLLRGFFMDGLPRESRKR